MSENVFFKIDGEWFTDFIRTLYYADDKSYEDCKEKLLLSLCLEDISNDDKEELAQAIIFGDKKFVGVNSLDLVDDNDFDVYNYSRFSRPKFNVNGRGIRGILTKEGIFVPCEFQGHASTIEEIGIAKCKGALQFWNGLMSSGVAKDEQRTEVTKYQKKFFEENKQYMNEEQLKSWKLLIENETLRKEYNLDC
jgi:hypothetical protein